MESRFHGAPISATQMAPKAAPSYKGIRAPLTVDESDIEYFFLSKSRRNSTTSSYYSGSELESEGFESGEDDSETLSERVEKGEGILEETHFVKEFAFSEPSVRSPDENFSQESGDVCGNAVFRPSVRIPNERKYKGNSNADDSDDSGSFLSESGDELVKEESYVAHYGDSRPLVAVKDEKVLVNGPSLVVDIRIPPVQKLHIPIAQISADSDDDSQGSSVLDDEGFSGIVRVPSIEVLRRINSAPIVRISESDEGDDNESQAENIAEGGSVEDLEIRNAVLGQDKGPDIDKEATANSLVVNEESGSTSESVQDGHLDVQIQEIDVIDKQKKCVELVDHREPTDFAEDIIFPENVSGHSNQSENVESECEHEIDPIVESFSSSAQCVDIKEVPTEGCLEFPESPISLTESMQVYMSDSHFRDASFTGVIDAGQSVFEGSVLDQETRKETENSDHLLGEVDELAFHSETKAVVAETNRIRDSTSFSNGQILLDHSQEIDGRVVTDFHEDADGGVSDRRHVIDPAALAAFFGAVSGAMSDDGIDNFSLDSNSDDLCSFRYASPPIIAARNSDNFMPPPANGELEEASSEREKKKIEKIQLMQVKYLRLLHRLGCSPVDSVASKVLYQLTIAEESSSSQAIHLDSAKKAAMELEAQKKDDLDFSLSILVIGKTGVGKSATINSIFGERKAVIDAFEPATTHVKEIIGMINGVKLKFFDTPGLRSSLIDQSINRKILSSIKKLMQKSPPDIILYVDRLDTQTSLNDLPLLKSLTFYLGSSLWRKSIVAFTHGTSVPPDGPNGHPLSYEAFVAQQSRVIEQLICHSDGKLQVMNQGLMIPVCLVENHPFAEKNGHGETLLHNGESWRSQLLLLCCSMKILSELSSVVTVQNPLDHRRHPPALFYFLSSFLQLNGAGDDTHTEGVVGQETGAVPLPDMGIPPSFDGDNPSFRYRSLEPSSWLLTGPVLNSHGWDHDCGCNGVLIEDKTDIANHFPAEISVQLTKDKKEFTIQLHASVSAQHGDTGSTVAGLDILTLGKKLAYTLRGETTIKNFRKNKTGAGASITFVGKNVVSGLKVEDHLAVGKRLILVGNAGVVRSHDAAAYGVNLDLCRRDKCYPIGKDQTSLGLSIMRYRGDLICRCNLQSQFSVSRNSKLNLTAALTNNLSGQISIKMSCSDQLHIAALALVPIARAVFKKMFRPSTEDYSI